MTNALTTTVSRRGWLARMLMAAAVAPVVGVRLADTVVASKKEKRRKSIKERADAYRRACVSDGGTATVTKKPGGTTVACTGGTDATGEQGDWTCTVHSKGSRCHKTLTNPPTTKPGGGGAVPPSGGAEDPTDTGANPGGGGGVDPGPGADPSGGSQDPVLE